MSECDSHLCISYAIETQDEMLLYLLVFIPTHGHVCHSCLQFFVKLITVGFFECKLLELHILASDCWKRMHDTHLWAPWAGFVHLIISCFLPFVLSVFEIRVITVYHSDTVPIFCPYVIRFSYYVVLPSFCNKKRNVCVLLENTGKRPFI